MEGFKEAVEFKNRKRVDLAKIIFDVVERDLRDRRGLKWEWDKIDPEVQDQIRLHNITNIYEVLKLNEL